MALKEYSVAILTPSCRNPSWGYTTSLLSLMIHVAFNGIHGRKASACHYVQPKCSCLPNGRQYLLNICLDLAREGKLTHAVFIDDDIQFEPTILDDLVWEGKCVGANCLRKEEGGLKTPNTVKKNPEEGLLDSTNATGLEEISAMGMGVFCMDLQLLLKVEAPHFLQTYDPNTGTYIGEDISFTTKLKDAGIKLYCSHEASRKVGHMGERLYKF